MSGANFGLGRPYFRLVGSHGLNLRTIVGLTGAILWLGRSIHFYGSCAGLTWANFRLAGSVGLWPVSGVRSSDARLRGDGTRRRNHRWAAFVHVVELLAVFGRRVLILDLCGHRRRSRAAEGCNFCGLRTSGNASTATVVGYAGIVVYDDGAVINMSHVDVDSIHRAVVVEVVSVPVATMIAKAGITEAVVNASVETNVEAPIATVEAPAVVIPTPVTGSPECAIVRRSAPRAGDPVVAGGSPIPVAGSPDVVGSGGYWLIVFGQGRRRLVGIFGGSWLAFLVKLIEGLSILIGLVLIRRGRGSLSRRGLGILLSGLFRSGLGTGG